MKWRPTTEAELLDEVNSGWDAMPLPERRLWESIKVDPCKWSQDPWGNEGGGFWVVAIYGNTVVWYNDIEEGFNRSRYLVFGEIEEYWCNQDELQWVISHILNEIKQGFPSGGKSSPPRPLSEY